MNTTARWHYNKKRLAAALLAWRQTGPDEVMRARVDDALKDPPSWGTEDPDSPGVFHREVTTTTGAHMSILYAIPKPETGEVGVADIRTAG